MRMTEHAADLIVIGTGGAAMAAGIEARSRGKTVLLVEHGRLGGTCLNVGCVPSKNLLAAAGQRHRALANRFPMAPTSAGGVDVSALMAQKQDGFPVRYGHARFVDGQTLQVDGERLRAPAYVIATGAAPHVPDLPGLDQVAFLTSTTAMEQQDLPGSMVIVGGGYVGLEQAQLWANLGAHVTLVGRFAPRTEPEVAEVLRGVFADDGIAVVEDQAVAVTKAADGVSVRTEDGQEVGGERLLIATGRFADTGDLGLQAAGIGIDERGFVEVDSQQRTTNRRVFAAGDVCGAPQYVYVAARTGHVAAAGALGEPATVDYRGLPAVIFTTPQIASAGLTEQQALAAGAHLRLPSAERAGHPTCARQPRHPRHAQARRGRGHRRSPWGPRGAGRRRRRHARRHLRDQVRADRRRPRRHLGAVPDDERGTANRGRVVPQRQARQAAAHDIRPQGPGQRGLACAESRCRPHAAPVTPPSSRSPPGP